MIWKYKGGYLVAVCISNVECIRFRDDDSVALVEHLLSSTVMPGLYDPLFRYVYILSFVGEGIVP